MNIKSDYGRSKDKLPFSNNLIYFFLFLPLQVVRTYHSDPVISITIDTARIPTILAGWLSTVDTTVSFVRVNRYTFRRSNCHCVSSVFDQSEFLCAKI